MTKTDWEPHHEAVQDAVGAEFGRNPYPAVAKERYLLTQTHEFICFISTRNMLLNSPFNFFGADNELL